MVLTHLIDRSAGYRQILGGNARMAPARKELTASHFRATAPFNRQALKRYLRSFSTRVVRRIRKSRAASATVPSASSNA
jgi:hypothetical protein